MKRLTRHLTWMLMLLFAATLTVACARSASDDDSVKGGADSQRSGAAPAAVSVGRYDAALAKSLCDKYGAGMLSASDYTDIIKLVKVSYSVLGDRRDSLLLVAQTGEGFYKSSYEMQDAWSEQFPHAEYLARIMIEADTAAMGEDNLKAWRALDTEMSARMKAYDEIRVKRFGQYR